jgi:hypothetical protein
MGRLSQHSQQIVLVSLAAADCTSITGVDLLRFEPVRQGKFSQLASSVAKVFQENFTGFISHVIGQLH